MTEDDRDRDRDREDVEESIDVDEEEQEEEPIDIGLDELSEPIVDEEKSKWSSSFESLSERTLEEERGVEDVEAEESSLGPIVIPSILKPYHVFVLGVVLVGAYYYSRVLGIAIPIPYVDRVLLFGGGGLVGLAAVWYVASRFVGEPDLETFEVDEEGRVIDPATERSFGSFRLPVEFWKIRRERIKRKKLRDDGYVLWYLIDSTFPRPYFVKPEPDGGGVPTYEYDGMRYFFTKEAMAPESSSGIWVAVHQKGDADPIALTSPKEHSIPADAVEEWHNMTVATSERGLLERLDITPQKIMYAGIALAIAWGILREGAI